MGANQDVEKVAFSISINNHILFDASPKGTNKVFSHYRGSYSKAMASVYDGEDLEDALNF